MWQCVFVVALYHARNAPFHPSVHNMGNVGFGGKLHANVAMASTRMIDQLAYKGRNVRADLADGFERESLGSPRRFALDIGCGVGMMSRELARGSWDLVLGVDTSQEMLDLASYHVSNATFQRMNAVDVHRIFELISYRAFGCIVSSFVFHEMPRSAHRRTLRSMLRLLRECDGGVVSVVDISPSYSPSPLMLLGEPFLNEYLETFAQTAVIEARRAGHKLEVTNVIEGHITMWSFR